MEEIAKIRSEISIQTSNINHIKNRLLREEALNVDKGRLPNLLEFACKNLEHFDHFDSRLSTDKQFEDFMVSVWAFDAQNKVLFSADLQKVTQCL